MVSNASRDAQAIAYTSQYEKFVKDFPDIKVIRESVAHDEYETKLKTYIAAAELPDAFMTKGTVLPELARDGEIMEIMSVIRSVPGWEQEYPGGVYEDFIVDEKVYAIPYQSGVNHCIFYNVKIFTECGIDEFPVTWQGFLDTIEKVKTKGYVPILMGNKEQWPLPSLFFNTVVYRYAPVEWYYNLRDNKGANFTDSQFIKAAETLQDLVKTGAFNSDLNSIDNQQKDSVYFNGKAAMMVDGYWEVATLDMNCPKDVLDATRIGILPAIPREMGGTGVGGINQAASGWGFGIKTRVNDSAQRALADYLHYVCGSDFATTMVEVGGGPAAKPKNPDESRLSPLYRELLRHTGASTLAPVFDVQLNAQIVDAFYSNLQDVAVGRMTAQRYAELLQAELEATRRQ
ncbi:MAG: extracellular solute-binding protein [Treponema sp.]|nr:extracellular solute-binding protein [Treponema sp.]